jgi:hypothetical protein
MVINNSYDLIKLAKDRIEKMEDLNQSELFSCVRSFINAAVSLTKMNQLVHDAELTKKGMRGFTLEYYREWFELEKLGCMDSLKIIDRLTLGDNDAE